MNTQDDLKNNNEIYYMILNDTLLLFYKKRSPIVLRDRHTIDVVKSLVDIYVDSSDKEEQEICLETVKDFIDQ